MAVLSKDFQLNDPWKIDITKKKVKKMHRQTSVALTINPIHSPGCDVYFKGKLI